MLTTQTPSTDQADETAVYFEYTDGRPDSTIARYGTRVVVMQAGNLISDAIHADVPTARAAYANWNCDPKVNDPAPGDVIEVATFRTPVTIMVVMDTTVMDTQHHVYMITGRTRPADGTPGTDVTTRVSRHEVRFVSRPAPAPVPTVATPTMSSSPVIEPVTGSVTVGTVTAEPARPVPTVPRFRPVTWTEYLARQARRPVVRHPARPTVSVTQRHAHVNFAVRYEVGPDSWRLLREGRHPLRNPTQEALDSTVRHLASINQRDAERVQVTATVTPDGGGTLFAVAVADPTRRRQRAARRRYAERADQGSSSAVEPLAEIEWVEVPAWV